jgi:hypothetical protein
LETLPRSSNDVARSLVAAARNGCPQHEHCTASYLPVGVGSSVVTRLASQSFSRTFTVVETNRVTVRSTFAVQHCAMDMNAELLVVGRDCQSLLCP